MTRNPLPFAAVLALLAAALACRPGHDGGGAEAASANPLAVDPASYDWSANPALRDKVAASPHRYFRFVNVAFSREVCRRFADEAAGAPSFNLHGDAHLEQYAVTGQGWGLGDFDDSSTGPAVVDLVRFGTSLWLACEQQGCRDRAPELLDELLRGYLAALRDPDVEVPEPRLAARKRAGFAPDPEAYFAFVEKVMEPVPAAEAAELEAALAPYVAAMREENGELAASFFEIEKVGYLRLGVGSALDLKFLVRMRGPSADPLDDVVVQVKQVRDLAGIPCITTDPGGDPLRVLRGHLRIAKQPYRFLGYARLRERNFWVHAWAEHFSELSIEDDFGSLEEIAEVAFDVGAQLGRGHPQPMAASLDRQVRDEQVRLLERDGDKIRAACRDLARRTVAAWERFRAAS